MNDSDLNRIFEETFQTIVRNEGPAIFQSLSNFVQDMSNVTLLRSSSSFPGPESRTRRSTSSFPQPIIQQVPINYLPEIDLSSNSLVPNNNNNNNNNEMLDDFSMRWFQQLNSYHNCMRDYHKNMIQMNRITNNLLINIASGSRGGGGGEGTATFLHPSIEIQGFSIPFPQSQSQSLSYPTISQIMSATDVFIYSEEHVAQDGMESRCPISLEDFTVGDELCEIRNCHHIFKWTHLQSWFSRNSNCPVCRFDIRQTDSE